MELLKILLVDDEILVRVGIKSIINWEEHGYTIVSEASDGFEALEKVRSNTPDIVLTDLVMDKMNGFELIKIIRKEYPLIKIIVLSCYNDFDNVKEAMRLGANDYIFKLTVKPEELLKTLESFKDQIDDQQGNPLRSQRNDRIVHKNIHVLKSKLIKTAIERSYLRQECLIDEMGDLGIGISLCRYYYLIQLSIDEFYRLNINSKIKEIELLKFSMLNIIEEVLQKYKGAEPFDFDNGDIIVIVNCNAETNMQICNKTLTEIFDTVNEYIKRYLGISVSAGVSCKHKGVHEIQEAAAEAVFALNQRFFNEGGCIYFSPMDQVHELREDGIVSSNCLDAASLYDAVEHLKFTKIIELLNNRLEYLIASKNITGYKIRSLLLELLYPFINTAKKRGIDIADLKDDCGFNPYEVLIKYDSLPVIKVWFKDFVVQFVEACKKKNDNKCREEIIKIKDFVGANIHKDISISTASRYINMSESYFSHLFKKETGVSFVDYVNNLKIEKAKELILQTDFRIYEIASMIGFDNANYFSMLFKRITGSSPNDYRK